MARINIEDSLWEDERFLDLVSKVGNVASAVGAVVLAFKLAQRFWVPDERPIPSVRFRSIPFSSDLISTGLARESDDGAFIHVSGSKDQFSWLTQRSKAGRENKGKKRERKLNGTKRNKTELNGSNPPSPSLTPSLPLSPVFSEGENSFPDVKNPIGFFIGRYVNAYQKKFGQDARPDLRGKVQGQIKRFVSETPLDRAVALIEQYLEMNDYWFTTKAYDFGTFVENLSKVGLALDTGKRITQADARSGESVDFYKSQMQRLAGDQGGAA